MRLELGIPVRCSDGPGGELADVVIDPTHRRVKHLVVKPHDADEEPRLVPAELAQADPGSAAIILRCGVDEFKQMPAVEEFAYLRFGEFPLDDPNWDVGIQDVLAQPYYDYEGFGANPMDVDPHVGVIYDRIPKGEVEIRRSSEVVSSDGHRLGHVDGFLVDPDDHITHLVLERGHILGRREVTIPIGSVARVESDEITVSLTKDEVGRLPSERVRRWAAQAN